MAKRKTTPKKKATKKATKNPARTPAPKKRLDPTQVHKEEFLAALVEYGNVTETCRDIGWDRGEAYRARAADPEFSKLWKTALEMGLDALEDEAKRRAYSGTIRRVTVAGEAATVREYSDTLLIFLLKSYRPAIFRERYEVKNTVEVENPIPQGGNGWYQAITEKMAERQN